MWQEKQPSAVLTSPQGKPDGDMKIRSIEAFPVSFPTPNGPRLAIGQSTKRDAVIVKIVTEGGIVGYGEAHHARSAATIAQIINTTLRDLILPASAEDIVDIWGRVYQWQLRSHGLGAATVMALSGIDQALWDIKGKASGLPLYRLLGGSPKPVKIYAGGIALGWQDPASLVDEIHPLVAKGYRAVKLRGGDIPPRDIARVEAVRKAFPDMTIMIDANTGYSVDDARAVMPAFEALKVYWLEEPFAPHDHYSYAQAATFGRVPLAAGENHYTRYEFARVIEDKVITVLQPDLSKAGGVTEVMRIAATASTWRMPICPHTSISGLNMAATLHLLSSIDNAGYFEADVAAENPFRDRLTPTPYVVQADGTVVLSPEIVDKPGLGVEVDEDLIAANPFIAGRNFV